MTICLCWTTKHVNACMLGRHPWLSGIPLPQREELEVAPQTEDDIRSIVERARQRRLAKRASGLRQIQSGIPVQNEE